ncbi:hypothetical protein [Photobacterium leiognathi]|uniref:hypothetical protein n=1 Tax=Photobacterium leiognathi TaxID=553611 RepID=UPI002981C2E0|nr:hypothetical protein [Photobacterium leiognathi]
MLRTNLTIGIIPQYILDLNRHLKANDLDYLCIDNSLAKALIDGERSQSAGLTLAIYRYNQILPERTICFFESNIKDFIDIYRESEYECELIRECLQHGMSQRNVSDIFGIPPKTLRVIFPNITIDKSSNRTQLSISALLLIDNELQDAQSTNKLVFSTTNFAKFMLKISNILIVNNLSHESNIAPIIRYIYSEEYQVRVYQESKPWNNQNGELIEIDIK